MDRIPKTWLGRTLTFQYATEGKLAEAPIPWGADVIATLHRAFEGVGWQPNSGPWPWFETDYRIDATVGRSRISLILVLESGGRPCWLSSEESEDAPPDPEDVRAAFIVAGVALRRRPDVLDVREHERFDG